MINQKRSFKFAIDAINEIFTNLNYKLAFLQKQSDIDLIKITYWIKLQQKSWSLLQQKLNKIIYDHTYKNSNFFYVLQNLFETHLENGTPYFIQLENNTIFNKFLRGNFGKNTYEYLSTYVPEFSQSEFNKNKLIVDLKNMRYPSQYQYNQNQNNTTKPFKPFKIKSIKNKTLKPNNTTNTFFTSLINDKNKFLSENDLKPDNKDCINYWYNPKGCNRTKCEYQHYCPFKTKGCNKNKCNLQNCEFAKSIANYTKWIETFNFK